MVNNFLKGKKSPPFISEIFRRYAPETIVAIPTSLTGLGISWIAKAAKIVVKIGLKEDMGETREIGEILIAR